jgi:hypothetical protein
MQAQVVSELDGDDVAWVCKNRLRPRLMATMNDMEISGDNDNWTRGTLLGEYRGMERRR